MAAAINLSPRREHRGHEQPAKARASKARSRGKNWLFTWLDDGSERTGNILSVVATCIAHDVNQRAYLHKVVHCIAQGWPQDKLRDLLPDRMLAAQSGTLRQRSRRATDAVTRACARSPTEPRGHHEVVPSRYIRSGPPLGLNPPGKSFNGAPPMPSGIRVDVEIWAGTKVSVRPSPR